MPVKQITHSPRHHQLTNAQVWTPDSQWVACDFRSSTSNFDSQRIEKIHIDSGEAVCVYRARAGAHVGVVTVSPVMPERFVFIHGPEYPDAQWHYDFHHRRGVIKAGETAHTLDAMDITAPFTPGALRGGSHVHMFSPDGTRISFTYNDHVMHERCLTEDLRNVGVAVPLQAVKVVADHPREYSGSHFCVLVSETVSSPQWGSDQISRAYEEAWIGDRGYRKADGEWQRWALAFIGDTRSLTGETIPEIFIVDLPQRLADYAQAGTAPLEGTTDRLPAPPAGIKQQRLTFSEGISLTPRHWLRSSPDGEQIAFLRADAQGKVQLWTLSPRGGEPRQLTRLAAGVESAFTWHPKGSHLAFISAGQVMVYCLASDSTRAVSPVLTPAPCPEAVVWSPDGQKIVFMQVIGGWRQLCMVTEPLSQDHP